MADRAGRIMVPGPAVCIQRQSMVDRGRNMVPGPAVCIETVHGRQRKKHVTGSGSVYTETVHGRQRKKHDLVISMDAGFEQTATIPKKQKGTLLMESNPTTLTPLLTLPFCSTGQVAPP